MEVKNIYFLIIVSLIVLSGCTSNQTRADVHEHSGVTVQVVGEGGFSEKEVIGRTEEMVNVAITPKIPGELKSLKVSKGDMVEKGQVLAKIDDRDLKRALELQQKSLKQAQSYLEQTKLQWQQAITKQKNQIQKTNLALETLKAKMEEAEKNFERMKSLFHSGVISQSDYEKAQNTAIQAKNAFETAKVNLVDIKSTENIEMLKKTMEQAQAKVNLIQTQIKQAKDRVNDTVIKAPHAGEVIAINGDLGELISNRAPLFTIISIHPIKVKMAVNPEELTLFKEGKTVKAEIMDLHLEKTAEITFITPVADVEGLYTIEATIPNEDKQIKPGMDVRLWISEDTEGLVIQENAVIKENDENFVYVVENKKAVKKSVEVVKEYGGEVAVKGINIEDQVIVDGQRQVKNGKIVTVVNKKK